MQTARKSFDEALDCHSRALAILEPAIGADHVDLAYALLGIGRDNKAGRLQQLAKNYAFFGAPAALFFVIDRRMGHGQWAHLGMFMQSVALAAVERGVASCFQELWGTLRDTLHGHFQLDEHQLVYCGMALGYSDPAAAINTLRTEREPVDAFARFHFD